MKRNLIETLMGAIVLVVAIAFVFTTYKSSGIKDVDGYQLTAVFDRVDGIASGSDVRIGGIKVGTVTGQALDPESYRAKVTLNIQNNIRIPTDSTAEIVSDGLLGGKYISLVPGAEIEMLRNNGEIEYTQSSVNIEQLIGKFAFGGTDSEKTSEAKTAEAPVEEPLPEPVAEVKKEEPKPVDPAASVIPPGVASPKDSIKPAEAPKKEAPKVDIKVEDAKPLAAAPTKVEAKKPEVKTEAPAPTPAPAATADKPVTTPNLPVPTADTKSKPSITIELAPTTSAPASAPTAVPSPTPTPIQEPKPIVTPEPSPTVKP